MLTPRQKLFAVCTVVASMAIVACGGGDDSGSASKVAYNGYLQKAQCGTGDLTETGLQGQVPQADRLSGRSARGYNCNLTLIGHFASASFANMDAYKNCVYYSDNKGGLGFRTGQGGPADGGGVVLDVSNPANPVKTAYLTAWAMKNAGESLRVNHKRGLLVADYYNIGSLAVYDISKDCTKPIMLADIKTMPRGAVGHEGCFSPDGMVYLMGTGGATVSPIDLTDPANPVELSTPWPLWTHGCSISADGTRAYLSGVNTTNFNPATGGLANGQLRVVDITAVKNRQLDAVGTVVSMVESTDQPILQSSYPITYGGKPYLFSWAEASGNLFLTDACATNLPANFGAARILDISDEKNPKEVSQLKLEVHDPKNCAVFKADRGPQTQGVAQGDVFWSSLGGPAFLYDNHYCRPDRLNDPTVMGCVNFGSGLRIYDIRDPANPKEIAYYNLGTVDTGSGPVLDFAVSPPVFRRDLGQVWWVTLYGGFHSAQFRDGVWPMKDEVKCVAGYDYFADQYDPTYCRSTWH